MKISIPSIVTTLLLILSPNAESIKQQIKSTFKENSNWMRSRSSWLSDSCPTSNYFQMYATDAYNDTKTEASGYMFGFMSYYTSCNSNGTTQVSFAFDLVENLSGIVFLPKKTTVDIRVNVTVTTSQCILVQDLDYSYYNCGYGSFEDQTVSIKAVIKTDGEASSKQIEDGVINGPGYIETFKVQTKVSTAIAISTVVEVGEDLQIIVPQNEFNYSTIGKVIRGGTLRTTLS
jgi:hypothetical protein